MTTVTGHRTLRHLIEFRASSTPGRTFLIFDDLEGGVTRFTFREFDEGVNRAANVLDGLGIRAGDRVNLHLSNVPDFLFLWYGAAKLGAVIVPTNTACAAPELRYIVEHSGSRVIFTQAEHAAVAEQSRREVVLCTELRRLMEEQAGAPPSRSPKPLDEVAILYTSGTTARPKGVVVTNAGYVHAGETVAKAIRLGPEDRHLVVLPLFHANAQYYSTMSALVTGASVALMARFSASRFFDQCIAHECTVASLFAAPIRMILAQESRPDHRDHRLRAVLFAQNVTEAQLDEWDARFAAPLLQLWGMTETMGPPLMNPIDYERRNMTTGLPVMGYEVKLVDDSGNLVAPGDVGQIVVRGTPGWTVMERYLDNPEGTAKTLRDGWLWSGDNARQDEDGYFHFVDRAKDMIKRAGENVAASEVEAVILEHPKVFDCAVVGMPDELRDESIKAFVVLKEGAELEGDDVIAWCRERLAKFRVPEHVEFLAELPRTSVGKIQKHILRDA